jgi:hypothetical protein
LRPAIDRPRKAQGSELELAPEFVCLSFLAWGASPASQLRAHALALALENNQ